MRRNKLLRQVITPDGIAQAEAEYDALLAAGWQPFRETIYIRAGKGGHERIITVTRFIKDAAPDCHECLWPCGVCRQDSAAESR